MIGKIYKYDKLNEIGYIYGYDELTYFYHQNNVLNHNELKEGDIVSFDYIMEKTQEQLPYAINIVKEEKKNGSKSYRELYEIIKYLPIEEKNKIPKKFMNEIKSKMDINYDYKVEHIKDFENQKMLDETRCLLAVVYRDYLATKEEKEEILKKDKEELFEIEQEKRRKYNVDIFEKKEEKINTNLNENVSLTVKEKETWFTRFLNFFKRIFKK